MDMVRIPDLAYRQRLRDVLSHQRLNERLRDPVHVAMSGQNRRHSAAVQLAVRHLRRRRNWRLRHRLDEGETVICLH